MTIPANLSFLAPGASVTGVLSVDKGGTGAATLTTNNLLLGNGTGTVQFVAPGASGNVLTSNGTTWVSQQAAGSPAFLMQSLSVSAAPTFNAFGVNII